MIQLNKFGLCASQYLGTGRGQCPITDFGDLKGIGLLRKGTKLTVATDTLNETTFRALITDGKLHQLVGSFGFEDTTPENATEESTDGVMQVVRDGKPMYNMTFKKGYAYNQAVHSLKGFANWDILFYFTEGIFLATNFGNTEIKGFNAGMVDADSYKLKSGNVTEFAKIKFQLLDSKEYNERGSFFTYDELGFDALEIEGVINTNVVLSNLPVALDTELNVLVKDANNTSIDYTAEFDAVGDWKVLVNGSEVVIATVTIASGIAVLGIPALASSDVVEVSLNGVAADLELKYYKSRINKITVA